jgi:hypothetical protein
MRSRLLLAGVCGVAFGVLAAAGELKPLNVKTGLWLITKVVTWSDLPPQMPAMMRVPKKVSYSSCVTPQNLSSNPWADGSGEHCNWTVLNSNGTDMEVQGSGCTMGNGMTAQVHGQIHILDSENGTGSVTLVLSTGNGQVMNGVATYTGKWVGASCPAK